MTRYMGNKLPAGPPGWTGRSKVRVTVPELRSPVADFKAGAPLEASGTVTVEGAGASVDADAWVTPWATTCSRSDALPQAAATSAAIAHQRSARDLTTTQATGTAKRSMAIAK